MGVVCEYASGEVPPGRRRERVICFLGTSSSSLERAGETRKPRIVSGGQKLTFSVCPLACPLPLALQRFLPLLQ
jgi:hypothetical protein